MASFHPPDSDSAEQGRQVSDSPLSAAAPARRTLPPPEWLGVEAPHSAASVALERYSLGEPVARRSGARAELCALSARLAGARRAGDEATERTTAAQLSRVFAAMGIELDQATKLARRSLLLGDDPVLREELSGWFLMLGESALAAATLRPLLAGHSGPEAAELLLRIGSLLARAGEAHAARDALEHALRESSTNPLPAELLGSLAAFAPDAVSSEAAAGFYLDAAARRMKASERAQAFENLLRAFEIAPGYALPTERLAQMLAERGRLGAADEIRREHARHAGPETRAVHLRRLRDALRDADLPRALGAAFDARLDAEVDLKSVLSAATEREPLGHHLGFDELLLRLGLHDLLAARLELSCDLLSGHERARARVALAKLYSGPLARPDRALDAYVDALVVEPGNDEAYEALLRHALTMRDHVPLVDALVRASESHAPLPDRIQRLRQLWEFAEARLQEPSLMLWAAKSLASLERDSRPLSETIARLDSRIRLSDEALTELEAELTRAEGAERIEPLSRVASLLLSRPDRADRLLAVLLELVDLAPEERSFQAAVERVLVRQSRFEELGVFFERLFLRATSAGERARLGLLLSSVRRRQGDLDGALAALSPTVDEPGSYPAALSMLVLLAAQRGDDALRARALLRLSTALASPLRAVLGAFAGECLLVSGDIEGARRAVDQAAAAEPQQARPATARALVGAATLDRWGAQAMERAMGVVVPRAALSASLAATYDELGEPALAYAFCLRRIALRPGDLAAARDRLERALAGEDNVRLGDTLAWLLSQAQPLAELTEPISKALRTIAPLDPPRAAALARRALDVLGPRSTDLRLAILAVADIVGERGLAITAVERWLACGAPSSDRAELLLDLSRRRRSAGDSDGAARALMRAIRDGAWATSVLAELDVALPPRSSDGEIALSFARAEALSALSEADQRGTALAWRALGAAYWDLASDQRSAVEAWERAVSLDLEHGVEAFAADLVAFGGPELALTRLEDLAARRSEGREIARILSLAANIALETNRLPRALALALRSLEADPSRTDVLAVVERAVADDDLELLDTLYSRLGDAALGRFGQRAVHYRAARQLEKRRAPERALGHALRAFDAVPSEGVVYVTLSRLAERTGQSAELVRALERAAAGSRRADESSAWLRRAALLAGSTEEGLMQRVEVLLRALLVRPGAEVLFELGQAIKNLSELSPEERPTLELRWQRAVGRLLLDLDGPDGARVALAAARAALEAFDDEATAIVALTRAVECDPELDEFQSFTPFVARLASHAGELLAQVTTRAGQRFAGGGAPLFELFAKLATARGDQVAAARLLLAAAQKNPEDATLLASAEHAARATGDAELIALALDVLPIQDRTGALLDVARAAESDGEIGRAILAYEEVRELKGSPAADLEEAADRLITLYRRAGRSEKLEELLEIELGNEPLVPERQARLAIQFARLLAEQGKAREAFSALERALREAPEDRDVLTELAVLARRESDHDRLLNALSLLTEVQSGPERLAGLRELASLHESVGNYERAARSFAEVQRLDPSDVTALAALEREAERVSDYDALATLLARRAALAASVDEVRRIRLRRASVLEQRLGRADEARAELDALVAATGDNLSVLRVLADLNERLGAPLRAAPLWLRASAVTVERDEAADLSCKACEAYLLAGDLDSARRVLDGIEVWSQSERVLKLAAEIERRRENPLALADALDDLSQLPEAAREQRAAWLLEAAQATLAGGARDLALARARRSLELRPNALAGQLFVAKLEYQARRAGSPEDALATLDALSHDFEPATPEQAELFTFLRAEALDAAGRSQEATDALELSERELGVRPLLALAFGERLSRFGDLDRSLLYFDAALGGDLRDLRGRGQVAWHAAEVALALGDLDRTASYLEISAEDPETRQQATTRIREIFSERVSSPPPGQSEPVLRASNRSQSRPSQPVPAERALASLGRYSARPAPAAAEERIVAQSPATPALDSSDSAQGRYSLRPDSEGGTGKTTAEERSDSSSRLLKFDADEASLYRALAEGAVEAGHDLILKLEHRADRTQDLVAVCRRLVAAQPGDGSALDRLHRAALADRNYAYARAIEHVIGVLDPGAPYVEPPALRDQSQDPDAVRVLLLRDHASSAFDALSLVWEGAERIFRRDPSTYGVTGLERVPVGAPMPLARMYSEVANALGMLRTPLFQRRSAGAVTVSLALLAPPAVVVSGDVRNETPELAFQLGSTLLAATPHFALLLGSPESQARAVLKGLGFAFGPTQSGGLGPGAVPNLAEVLWESIPARLQRRLRELCDAKDALDYDVAIRLARSATRRAGLFACGNLGVALSETCIEEGIPESALGSFARVATLAAQNASVRSLLGLATSPEYAQIRWWLGRSGR